MSPSGSSPLCGVELMRPNAAWDIARARSGSRPCVHGAKPVGPQLDVLTLKRPHPLAVRLRQRLPVAVLDDDQRPVPERELDVPVDEGAHGGHGVGRLGRTLPADRQQLLADRDQHLGQDGVLAGEVLVEPRARDADGGAEVGDRYPVEAAGGEELGRSLEDLLATAGRRAAHRAKVSVR